MSQQDVAMTMASCALNVAEVFGSFMGAVCFDMWGQRGVFWVLAFVSLLNQLFLVWILYEIKPLDEVPLNSPPGNHLLDGVRQPTCTIDEGPDAAGGPTRRPKLCGCLPPVLPGSVEKLKSLFAKPLLLCAVILIAMSAVVKGSVEEMLPFHCDHRWRMQPLEIGKQFCIIATAYIIAAFGVGRFWNKLGIFQVGFASYWLFMLGVVAWLVFAIVAFWEDESVFAAGLVAYGICLGMTHTPAALLLASVIDDEQGAAKDAVNGIFHTMWEAGGSLGFLLGGLLAERYHEQMALLTWYTMCCAVAAITMITIASWPCDGCCVAKDSKLEKLSTTKGDYGTITSASDNS